MPPHPSKRTVKKHVDQAIQALRRAERGAEGTGGKGSRGAASLTSLAKHLPEALAALKLIFELAKIILRLSPNCGESESDREHPAPKNRAG